MIKKRNELLNIMEAVAAILVVFIHFKFPNPLGNMVTAVARVSVPFFFCISGYFFYKGSPEKEMESISGKIKRLLLLILASETVYFLFYLVLQVDNHGFTFQALINVIELEVIGPYLDKLTDRLTVFAPPLNGIFWFVGSLVVVYVCVYFVVKHGRQQFAFTASLVFLLIGFILRRILFCMGINTTFPYERLLPFLPIPFFMIGYFIRKNQEWFNQISNKVYGYVFTLGLILTLVEQFFGVYTLYLGTLILVPAMISFCGKHSRYIPKTTLGRFLSHMGAETATYIYMLHMLVSYILGVIVPPVLNMHPHQETYMWLFPILVCVSSIACGEAICILKRLLFKKR